jgi:hypothetical protein
MDGIFAPYRVAIGAGCSFQDATRLCNVYFQEAVYYVALCRHGKGVDNQLSTSGEWEYVECHVNSHPGDQE